LKAKERICKAEDRSVQNTQTEAQREKIEKGVKETQGYSGKF
jgi:hypothetical protein